MTIKDEMREKAARALCFARGFAKPCSCESKETCRAPIETLIGEFGVQNVNVDAVIEALYPIIRGVTLEEAAQAAEGSVLKTHPDTGQVTTRYDQITMDYWEVGTDHARGRMDAANAIRCLKGELGNDQPR